MFFLDPLRCGRGLDLEEIEREKHKTRRCRLPGMWHLRGRFQFGMFSRSVQFNPRRVQLRGWV